MYRTVSICKFETPVMRFVTGSCCRIVACWRFPFTRHSQTICALLCRLKVPVASLQGLSMLKVSVFVLSKLLGFGCIEFQSNACQRCHQLWFFCCIHPRPCRWNLNDRWRDFWAKLYPSGVKVSVDQLCFFKKNLANRNWRLATMVSTVLSALDMP